MIVFKINNKVIPEIEYIFDLKNSLNNKKSKLYRKNKIWDNADVYIEYIIDGPDGNGIFHSIDRIFQKLPIRSIILKNFISGSRNSNFSEIFAGCKKLQIIRFLDENNNDVNFFEVFKDEKFLKNNFSDLIKDSLNLKYFRLGSCEIDANEHFVNILCNDIFKSIKQC